MEVIGILYVVVGAIIGANILFMFLRGASNSIRETKAKKVKE